MKLIDFSKIKNIHFNFPELMNDSVEKSIRTLYGRMKELRDEAAELRMQASKLDKQREELEKQWQALAPFVDIEFESEEVKDKVTESGLSFNFHSEINKGIH